jgi:glycosyltransferase involved in cell wall biosynthesis
LTRPGTTPEAATPLLLHVFPTFVAGGAQVRTVRLMDALGGAYRHAVLALDGRTEARELVPREVALEVLPALPRAGSLATARRLRRLLGERRPHLVCTYNWGSIDAVLAARSRGLPVLHHEDGFGADEAAGPKRRRVWARRLLLPGAAGVVVPSFTLEALATGTWKLPPARVHRIANGVRIERFPPADGNPGLRADLGIPADAPVVGAVGHLRAEKNPVRLVEAFALVDTPAPAHLLVLGEGPEEEAVRAAARRTGVEERVHLVGHQDGPSGYYRAMDLFALSSNTEQMPVALLEAMAAALPVASTDVGDIARILPPDQQAHVVPPAPAEDAHRRLAEALQALLDDRARARALGAANRTHVEATYRFEAMVAAYRERYEAARRAG